MRWHLSFAVLATACSGSNIDGVLDVPKYSPDAAELVRFDAAAGGGARDASVVVGLEDAGVADPEAPQVPTPPADLWNAEWAAREMEMLALVNELRAQGARCGRRSFAAARALAMNAELREAARLHSKDMADTDYFDHNSRDGRDPWDRIRDSGYAGAGIGENIAAGNETARATFAQWVESSGHCANMMNPDAHEIGIGYAHNPRASFEHYWTQTFGQ